MRSIVLGSPENERARSVPIRRIAQVHREAETLGDAIYGSGRSPAPEPRCYGPVVAVPSHLHEALLLLFRNRPELAPELLRDALHQELPAYTEARIESADLTDIQPAEYRADLVVLLYDGKPVLGIVVEVQLAQDDVKQYSWPVYVAGLRARIRCPVCLLVVTANEPVARWASRPIDLGGGNHFAPLVLGPSGVPVVTDEQLARTDPELAVLSAMAHGQDSDEPRAIKIAIAAMAASVGLDAERSALYLDLVLASLGEAARKALQAMDPAKYEYQSEFARRYVSQGRAEGRAEGEARGRADLVLKQVMLRFGPLHEATVQRVRNATIAELDAFAERVLSAKSLDEVLGPTS